MPAEPSTSAPGVNAPAVAESEARQAWFTDTPDPWAQIALLEFGGDRSFASAVEHTIQSAASQQYASLEARLLVALARLELTDAGRRFICRMLGLVGSAACVSALAPLLRENATADVARLALDHVEDPSVDAAYRAALRELSGAAKAGVIGRLALRGDTLSLDTFQRIAVDAAEKTDVRRAAERAVARLQKKG